ncbi:unnamed protein product [Closterium sp. NIES-53]
MRLAGSFTTPPRAVSLPSQEVMFDESVPFYHLFPYCSALSPTPPLFLAPGPPPVNHLPPQGPAPSGVSHVDPVPRTAPVEVAVISGAASGGATSGGAEPGGAEPEGAESKGDEPGGEESGGVGNVDPGGTSGPRPLPMPAPSPYTERSGGLTEHHEHASPPFSPVRTARRVPRSRPPPVPGTHAMAVRPSSIPLRVPLPAPPQSSLRAIPDHKSDRARVASSTVSRLLATAVTDPSFESSAASALVAELLEFDAACRLDCESESASPPSVGSECALGMDVLEDMQEDFECLAAPVPRFASILLAPEGDPDAPYIPITQSLRRPVYGLCQAPREWHDTLRTTLAALGFAPSTADPSQFLRTDTSLLPFYVLVYVLQRFGFLLSSPEPTPLSTGHSLSHPPSDKSVEPSGPYPELVGCLMYQMTCTRPDLAYPLSLLARYVAPFVLTGHADASWVDDSATQQSSQGYTFSLGFCAVSWRSTRSSSVLSSSCEAEIYDGAMAAQELRWLTYLLTDLGEQPRSPPVLYVVNKAMIALCQEHRLEHQTKHIALRYFLDRELQQRGQLHLAYVATRANTADVFTKALPPGDHQRFSTVLDLVPALPHLLTA